MCVGRVAVEWQQSLDDSILRENEALAAAAVLLHEPDAGLPRDHAVAPAGEEKTDCHGREDTADKDDVHERHRVADEVGVPPQGGDDDKLTHNHKNAEAEVSRPFLAIPAQETTIIKDSKVQNFMKSGLDEWLLVGHRCCREASPTEEHRNPHSKYTRLIWKGRRGKTYSVPSPFPWSSA